MPRGAEPFRLEDVRGIRPVILVFAPSVNSPPFEGQIGLLEDEDVAGRLGATLAVVLHQGSSVVDGRSLDDSSADALRASFGVEPGDFAIVLIGSDGEERHRDDAPLQPSVIAERLSDGTPR